MAWHKEKKIDITLKIFIFLVSPFFSFFYSFKYIKTKSSFVFFFLIALFFGMAFTVPKGDLLGSTYDGSYYREQFELFRSASYLNYLDGLKDFLTFNKGRKDYYFETVAFFVSRITNNYHWLFLAFAAVFAFFALKCLKFLTSENNFNSSRSSFILLYLFMMNQIFNINGVRFWTAAWIGVYCIFQIFRNGNTKYFLLAFCLPFVHGSYWFFIGVILIAFFLRKFEKVWVILFFASFLVSSIAVEVLIDASNHLPPFLQSLIQSYSSTESLAKFNDQGEGFSWIARLSNFAVRLYINLMMYFFIKNSEKIKANYRSKNLYTFLLVYMSIINFTMPIPSFGVRFVMLAYPIIAYIWLVNFKGKRYKQFLYALPLVFWFVIYGQIVLYLSVLHFDFYISNPFYLIYKYLLA